MARCESDNITSLWILKDAIYIQEVNKQRLYFFLFHQTIWCMKPQGLDFVSLLQSSKKQNKNVSFNSCVYIFFSVS